MINDRQLADAILARKPEGVARMEVCHDERNLFGKPWNVAMFWDGECIQEDDASLSAALAKANVAVFRKREQAARQKAMTLVFTPGCVA